MPYVGIVVAKERRLIEGEPAPEARRQGTLRLATSVEDDVHAIFAKQAQVLGTTVEDLVARLGRTNIDLLMSEVDWDGAWQAPLQALLGQMVRAELVHAGSLEAGRLGLRMAFNGDSLFAQAYTRDHVPNLVRETTLDTQMSIAGVLRRGFAEQRTTKWMATEIRQVVGLTSRQADSVMRLRRVMEGQGASQDAIDKAADRQQARLLRYRAETIARTETVRTSAAGTQAAWMQARNEGSLPEQAKRRWIAGPGERTCDICRGLEANGPVGIMESFRTGIIGSVFLPPAHPSCRCTVALVA